ncbi:MYO10, partial [Symbiodinium necroappetens]
DAEAALAACNGIPWPSTWPQRHDGKTLQLMFKADWLRERRDYNALYKAVKGPSFQTTFTKREAAREDVAEGFGTAEPSPSVDVNPEATEAPQAAARRKPPGSEIPGCLVRLTGFSDAENVLCIRQYVEHAVTVVYCDYIPNTTVAHVRLPSPGDCVRLLEDMKLTSRLLGCHRPTAEVLSPEEEEKYWVERLAASVRSREPISKKRGLTPQAFLRRDLDHKVSRIRRWCPKVASASHKFRAGFTDTAGSNADFVPAGFGKARRAAKVVPPRESGEAPELPPSSKVRRKEGSPRRGPLVPPPSPFQLPGTTRTRARPARRAPSVPPSPCAQDSPESDSARPVSPSSSRQAVTSPHSEPGKADGPVSPTAQMQEPPQSDDLDMLHPDSDAILDLLDELEGDM